MPKPKKATNTITTKKAAKTAKTTRPKKSVAVPLAPLVAPASLPPHHTNPLRTQTFGKTYLALSAVLLLVTTIFWALLGARVHQSNADQLVDPYLFSHWSFFHGSLFPGAHSFLLKWPLFALIGVFGVSPLSLQIFTVAVVLCTVGSLAWILQRIERRPLVLGTQLLALATCLLLVPAQPYAGGILPVNMAMLTTRNLEYIVYILSLATLVRTTRYKSIRFVVAVVVLAILIASDKLFLSLSIGGAVLAICGYAFTQKWQLVTLCVRWLVAGILAGGLAVLLLGIINIPTWIRVDNGSGASPYGLVQDPKNGAIAAVYAVAGFFTNFGANPAFDATQLRQIPAHALQRMEDGAAAAYIVNGLVALIGLVVALQLLLRSFARKKLEHAPTGTAAHLALLLIWSSLAAAAVFVASNHYYPVDARYLGIELFAVFISLAVGLRRTEWRPEWFVGAGLVLLGAIGFGMFGALQIHHQSRAALESTDERNAVLVQVLAQHHVDILVGDYWRVLPIKLEASNHLRVAPLGSCTAFRGGLTTERWMPDLRKHSFTYLISLDSSLTDFPHCSLKQVTDTYGNPNNTVLIAGDVQHPKELLLFYDQGLQPPQTRKAPEVLSTIIPITLADLPNTTCEGPTTLTVVAHQDDDLLFINPDTMHDITNGHCVRTVYLTAGDGGHDKFYWLGREQGSEAAYDTMTGNKKGWAQRTVQLPGKHYITVASPLSDPKVSLLFVHLPDGNLTGKGFPGSHFESLQRLFEGRIKTIHSVDGQSTYSSEQLVSALATIMHTYQPSQIRTQATFVDQQIPDHSDHMATSNFTTAAYTQYERTQYENLVTIPLTHYIGYPIRNMPANVSPDDLLRKQTIFFAYARFDGAVCYSMHDCSSTLTYRSYLERQYTQQ